MTYRCVYYSKYIYLAGRRPFANSGNANAPICKTDVRLKKNPNNNIIVIINSN